VVKVVEEPHFRVLSNPLHFRLASAALMMMMVVMVMKKRKTSGNSRGKEGDSSTI
jgi:hypothetical protein